MRNDFFSKLFEIQKYRTVYAAQSQAGGCKITTPCSEMRTEKRESYFRKSLQLRVPVFEVSTFVSVLIPRLEFSFELSRC